MDDLSELLKVYLKYFRSKNDNDTTLYDKYIGISEALRTKVTEKWIATQQKYSQQNVKRIYHISLEYNLGSPIEFHVAAGGLDEEFESLKNEFDISTEDVVARELPIELGNYSAGDFSGNILETFATNGIPLVAYGLWYGMAQFKQAPKVLGQIEMPSYWDSLQHPWTIDRPEYYYNVPLGGRVAENSTTPSSSWIHDDFVEAVSIDYPISGYRNGIANTVRFWKAVPTSEFRNDYSHHNDYIRACDDKVDSTKFMRYLFVDEPSRQTSEIHIKQQFFLAYASVKDILRRHVNAQKNSIKTISDKAQIYLADCRCGLVIVEFIRTLVYDYAVDIEEAIAISKKIFISSLPLVGSGEFQKIPIYVLETLLPIHVKIIKLMNHNVLENAWNLYQASDDDKKEISLIEEGAIQKVRMANLLLLFSNSILSFSQFDGEYIKNTVCPNTAKIFNVDIKPDLSAVSIRRWLVYSNVSLAKFIGAKIGDAWINDNSRLADFEEFATNASAQNEFESIKNKAKENFLKSIGMEFDDKFISESLFTLSSGKISIVNSQLRLLIYIACRCVRLNDGEDLIPRVYFFCGRAIPNDFYGKHLVSLIGIFSSALRDNPKLKVHFLPNQNASVEGKLLALSDMAEYVSSPQALETTAYNIYRCAANGVITLTGTNACEIQTAEKLGADCTFNFAKSDVNIGDHRGSTAIGKTPILQKAFDLIYQWLKDYSGDPEEEHKLYPILSYISEADESKTLMLFDEYCKIQEDVDAAYKNKSEWLAMGLRNIARSGVGSLDKTAVSLYGGKEGSVNAE